MTEFLTIEGLTKHFERKKALDDVSFSVQKGQIFGLLGPNGAGKTTLIRIINRIIQSDGGKIKIDGTNLSSEHIKLIGYMPEERGLYKKMKVGEQILFFAKLKGMNRTDAQKAADMWMKRLGIGSWVNDKVQELSKGMQQKVQFIITVLHNPKLLILDEPFTGFDPINVDLIKKQILYLQEQGCTIIFSTHNMSSVEEICEKIVLINHGHNILEGEINEVKSKFFEKEYEIEYSQMREGFAGFSEYQYTELKAKNGFKRFKVNLDNKNKAEFISYAAKQGDLISFNPVVPSLHDVFVKVVENYNKNNQKDE
jgi:ABC-2 type transport system ATP-binding protein